MVMIAMIFKVFPEIPFLWNAVDSVIKSSS